MRLRAGTLLVAVLAALLLAAPVAAHVNDVNVDAQVSPDGTVVVETAFIAEDGWLVVHADDGGEPGAVVGHRALSSEGGFKTDVTVSLDDDAWNAQDGTATRWVALHREGGGDGFDPEDDPILTTFGSPVAEPFALGKGERAVVTARQFAPQKVSEPEVTVRRAVLPSDGYLVVRNVSDGRLVGVRPLAAGAHENVSVALNESFFDSQSQSTLNATIYVDDGSGSFDDADEPFRVGGEPVRTTFGFRNGADETPTATPGPTDESTADDPGVTTATDTPTATEGSAVVTASPTPSDTPTPTGTGAPGFGLATAVAALLLALLGWRR